MQPVAECVHWIYFSDCCIHNPKITCSEHKMLLQQFLMAHSPEELEKMLLFRTDDEDQRIVQCQGVLCSAPRLLALYQLVLQRDLKPAVRRNTVVPEPHTKRSTVVFLQELALGHSISIRLRSKFIHYLSHFGTESLGFARFSIDLFLQGLPPHLACRKITHAA